MGKLILALLILVGCGSNNTSSTGTVVEASKLKKVWTYAYNGHTTTWDLSAFATLGTPFTAITTHDADTCSCSVTLVGAATAGAATVSCTLTTGSDATCNGSNSINQFSFDGSILTFTDGGIAVAYQ